MKYKPIYRNIQFKPKIWGLDYTHLFATLILFMVAVVFLKSFGLLIGFIGGAVLGGIAYAYFFYIDNRDPVEAEASKQNILKNQLTSYTLSHQKVIIKEGEK